MLACRSSTSLIKKTLNFSSSANRTFEKRAGLRWAESFVNARLCKTGCPETVKLFEEYHTFGVKLMTNQPRTRTSTASDNIYKQVKECYYRRLPFKAGTVINEARIRPCAVHPTMHEWSCSFLMRNREHASLHARRNQTVRLAYYSSLAKCTAIKIFDECMLRRIYT